VHVRGVGEGSAHPVVDVDERVHEHHDLEPVEAADLDGCQTRPLVVRAAEEGDREHDEPEHETQVPRFERRSEQQSERSHADARQRHEGDDQRPVKVDLRLHALGVDDRGDREDDGGGDEALAGSGDDLRDGHQPDRTRRLDAVLDLTGEAELLGELHGDGLDPLKHDGEPDHPGYEHRGERRLGAGHAAGGTDALSDLREDVEEDEAEEERLHQGAHGELDLVLPEHDHVAQDEGAEGRPACRGRRARGA
jgi:hypothetical protein